MATYYAERKSVKNGEAQAANTKYGTERAMERQFHLYCANACDGDDYPNDIDTIEWGTLEGGAVERKAYIKPVPVPEGGTE